MVNLDPQDWQELDKAFQQALEAGFSHYQNLEEQPVWQPAPEQVRRAFEAPIPREPQPLEGLVARFRDELLPYSNGNTHPGFYGWVHGGGNLYGALGELCAALLNSNLGGRDHLAHHVESQVIQWSRELFGFPDTSSGLLVSGTSMASLIALAVARQWAVGPEIKTAGLQGHGSTLVGYCSVQSHSSAIKAFQMLGLGSEALRQVPVHEDFTLDTQALESRIAADREAGLRPFCVIATLGTVNNGAIDDLARIAELCDRERLWFHLDAAFGGAVALLDEYQEALGGMAKADSLAFDFHKWFQVPYAVGGLLVRDAGLHQATFSERREYLSTQTMGLDAGAPWACDFGPELSRGFLALKVWFTFQGVGVDTIADVVRKHCLIAKTTAGIVDNDPDLERLAPVPMNIVCLRYKPSRLTSRAEEASEYLDALNRALVTQLQLQGVAAPSTTTLNGQLAIRVAIVNHRTEQHHLDDLLRQIRRLGERIDAEFTEHLNPAHWHLMQGGDERLMVDPETGLNRYGCSPSPRDHAFTFASSTATSISTPAYEATEQYRQQLLHELVAEDSSEPLARHARELEHQIARLLDIRDLDPAIHLSPSGTDAQLLAVAAITTAQRGDWVSVVCGADETGSGTPYSVTGCHFDNTTCLGAPVAKGERLTGMPAIGYEGVDFRDQEGRFRDPDAMDKAVEEAVLKRVKAGESVILHAMDQSKLGCWAPSRKLLDNLRRDCGERLQVVIDACQLRLDASDLQHHLEKEDIILVTGSKFFTGPPFSGATIYPAGFSDRLLNQGDSLPAGLSDYLPRSEMGYWVSLLPDARESLQIGVLLRWKAALTEAERYYRVPREARRAGLDRFSHEVMEKLVAHPFVEPLFPAESPWWARNHMLGEELSNRRSIFPFMVRGADGSCLDSDRMHQLYELLNRDLSGSPGLTSDEQSLAAQCCHLGQPVRVDRHGTSVLRISMGARVISDGCYPDCRVNDHLEEELRQVRIILDKLTLCLTRIPNSDTSCNRNNEASTWP